ncbi:MAG: hypothetical protein M1831_005287 [Alyxoria varia]|nr:MAG: hypothetical protein M1831_005287 [Alyxoria varia]
MAPAEVKDDYYAILGISQTATVEVIRKSYLRSAKDLHPDRNLNNVNATASFQLLGKAYETLIDPATRRQYDIQWPGIKRFQAFQARQAEARQAEARQAEARQAEARQAEARQAEARRDEARQADARQADARQTEARQAEARKRQAEAVKAAQKKAAEEALRREEGHKKWRELLRQLQQLKSDYENSLFQLRREIRDLEKALKQLQDQDAQEEKRRTGRITSLYDTSVETEEQKQQREMERLQRLVSQNIKRTALQQKQAKYKDLETALEVLNGKIAAEKEKIGENTGAEPHNWYERIRREQEAKRQMKEQQARERQARWAAELAEIMRKHAERAAKEAREAEQSRARESQEHMGRTSAAGEEQDEAEKRGRTARGPEDASHGESLCNHRAFWHRIEGNYRCNACEIVQRRFVFQCPLCGTMACARCRKIVKSQAAADNSSQGQSFQNTSYQ